MLERSKPVSKKPARLSETPIDLHVHTTFSDGTLTPREVIQLAQHVGLSAIAITDHDTVRGNREAIEEGGRFGIEVVPGVEVSVDSHTGTMHVLGYYIDFACDPLVETLQRIENARHKRNKEILEKLSRLGMPLDYEAIKAMAREGPVGRPHIAQALVKKGHVANLREAFDKYLKKGAPAYAERLRFSEVDAIQIIREAGGLAVLAHPKSLCCDDSACLSAIVARLVSLGLQGLEVYYPSHSPEMQRTYESLAKRYGLLVTGGTDFHGAIYPDLQLGFGYGDLYVPYSFLEAMKARCASNRARETNRSATPELRA
jgi:predicted metal-dependent phosphoesterase TrpH